MSWPKSSPASFWPSSRASVPVPTISARRRRMTRGRIQLRATPRQIGTSIVAAPMKTTASMALNTSQPSVRRRICAPRSSTSEPESTAWNTEPTSSTLGTEMRSASFSYSR